MDVVISGRHVDQRMRESLMANEINIVTVC